ncbi:glycosyltransferase [Brevibacillus humidisoli]|uniref:glycosyltransferase n=1 Tax=Brevibacillus humidisoli TaxID=2895522 RepID=UPI001E5C5BC5|nr:glycosyltransferase [Brevibacillus humidisoli]UFJ41954.1 glycosyltransferase [Brevibacillus humidisoli]
MNILLVTYSAYPRIGGRSTYISILKHLLEQHGHTVDILAHASGLNDVYIVGGRRVKKAPLRKRVAEWVVPLLNKRYPNLPRWIVWRETERCFFEEAIRQFDLSRYDVIHTQDIFSSLACQRAIRDKPIVASFHNCKVEEWQVNEEAGKKLPIEMAYVSREELLSVERQKRVIVPSRWLKDAFVRLGASAEKFTVIPYGMDIPQFQQKMRLPTDVKRPDSPLILCPARLVPIKGHTFLFEALQRLKEVECRFVCWVAGSGVLEQKLKREVINRGIDDVVQFIGGRSDLPAIMAFSDIVVLPTLHDTLPLVIMEAQIAGVPVVSTHIGGVTEMIQHDRTGFIGPPRDPGYLYRSLRYLIENKRERERLAGNALQEALATYSDAHMMKQTYTLYTEAIHSPPTMVEPADYTSIDEQLLDPVHQLGTRSLCEATGTLVGTVRSSDGRPLPHAAVHLMDISWVTLSVTQCDQEGRFAIAGIPSGKYAIITSVGEHWNSCDLVIRENEVTLCHAQL